MFDLPYAYRMAAAHAGIRSLRAMARKTGMSVRHVHRISRGEVDPSLSSLERLSDACGLPLSRFFALGEEPL